MQCDSGYHLRLLHSLRDVCDQINANKDIIELLVKKQRAPGESQIIQQTTQKLMSERIQNIESLIKSGQTDNDLLRQLLQTLSQRSAVQLQYQISQAHDCVEQMQASYLGILHDNEKRQRENAAIERIIKHTREQASSYEENAQRIRMELDRCGDGWSQIQGYSGALRETLADLKQRVHLDNGACAINDWSLEQLLNAIDHRFDHAENRATNDIVELLQIDPTATVVQRVIAMNESAIGDVYIESLISYVLLSFLSLDDTRAQDWAYFKGLFWPQLRHAVSIVAILRLINLILLNMTTAKQFPDVLQGVDVAKYRQWLLKRDSTCLMAWFCQVSDTKLDEREDILPQAMATVRSYFGMSNAHLLLLADFRFRNMTNFTEELGEQVIYTLFDITRGQITLHTADHQQRLTDFLDQHSRHATFDYFTVQCMVAELFSGVQWDRTMSSMSVFCQILAKQLGEVVQNHQKYVLDCQKATKRLGELTFVKDELKQQLQRLKNHSESGDTAAQQETLLQNLKQQLTTERQNYLITQSQTHGSRKARAQLDRDYLAQLSNILGTEQNMRFQILFDELFQQITLDEDTTVDTSVNYKVRKIHLPTTVADVIPSLIRNQFCM